MNVATAIHRLAVQTKRDRAGRDKMIRDPRFVSLVDAATARASQCNPRSVSDIMWGCATMQHWPPTMLKPMLTQVRLARTCWRSQRSRFQGTLPAPSPPPTSLPTPLCCHACLIVPTHVRAAHHARPTLLSCSALRWPPRPLLHTPPPLPPPPPPTPRQPTTTLPTALLFHRCTATPPAAPRRTPPRRSRCT